MTSELTRRFYYIEVCMQRILEHSQSRYSPPHSARREKWLTWWSQDISQTTVSLWSEERGEDRHPAIYQIGRAVLSSRVPSHRCFHWNERALCTLYVRVISKGYTSKQNLLTLYQDISEHAIACDTPSLTYILGVLSLSREREHEKCSSPRFYQELLIATYWNDYL